MTLDRDGPLFQALYKERTGCERVNARAKELGIERPRVRNRHSVAHLNTLIYVIVNGRVLEKAKSINQRFLQMHYLRLSIVVRVRAGHEAELIKRLEEIRQGEQSLFPGTVARFIVRSETHP